MKAHLIHLEDILRSNLWFLPTLMGLLSVGLYAITIWLDKSGLSEAFESSGWVYTGGPEGASTLLSALAGSAITVAGVTFSLLVAALSLASAQFGPRLLRNFMRDWFNQFALGIFSATFIYCLLVLRTVRGGTDKPFVPELSVTVGLVLGLLSIGVLAIFIHHVALSMQAAYVIATVSKDLNRSIDRLFPQMLGYEAPAAKVGRHAEEVPPTFRQKARSVQATRGGYLQVVDTEELLKVAIDHSLLIEMDCKPGDFMITGGSLLRAWPGERLNPKIVERLQAAFVLGRQRTPAQDVEADINQLVEVAIRALSPAINDPFTAMMCIDRLGEALCQLAQKPFPSLYRYDRKGNLRVITRTNDFASYVNTSFNQIRQYGNTSVSVTIRLLDMIGIVTAFVNTPAQCEALYRQAHMILEGSQKTIPQPEDRQAIEKHYQQAVKSLAKA